MESWNDITLTHRGERVVIDGVGFAAIGRLKLLQLLQARAASVGVKPVFGHAVQNLDDLDRADLIVGADGVNSLVRRSQAGELGSTVRLMTNRFAWFGTTKRFETLTRSGGNSQSSITKNGQRATACLSGTRCIPRISRLVPGRGSRWRMRSHLIRRWPSAPTISPLRCRGLKPHAGPSSKSWLREPTEARPGTSDLRSTCNLRRSISG